MANCELCGEPFAFGNKPIFGTGKLKSGGQICVSCLNLSMRIGARINTIGELKEAVANKSNPEDPKQKEALARIKAFEEGKQLAIIESAKRYEDLKSLMPEGYEEFYDIFANEISVIERSFTADEKLYKMTQCVFENMLASIFLTQYRTFLVGKTIKGYEMVDFAHGHIHSITYHKVIDKGEIELASKKVTCVFKGMDCETAEDFVKAAMEFVKPPKPKKTTASVATELKKLAELKDSGILTQDEFDSQKKKLLGL